MQTITCPICDNLMNAVQRRPFWHPCGAVCCEVCVSPNCVFCGEEHEYSIKELKPLTNILNNTIILCENKDGSAEFIESKTFLPYCKSCKGEKVGVDIEDDLFQGFFEGYLMKVCMVNEKVFEFVSKKVHWAKGKENWQKLRIVKVLAQFLNGLVFCNRHKEMRAVGIDLNLRFRCGFCEDEDEEGEGIVSLDDLCGCRRAADEFVKSKIEDEGVRLRLRDNVIWAEGLGSVKIIFEVLLAEEVENDARVPSRMQDDDEDLYA